MKNKSVSFGIFLLIATIALLINAGSYGVVETSDARYAEIAREMFLSGDFIHPKLLDIHHYHKPPFTYQITALGYAVFGINSFAARFFLQLSVLFQIWLVYKITLLLFQRKKTAITAAIIYFSLPLVLISSRNLTTDSFLTSFVLLSIYSWLEYYKNGKIIFLYLFALSLGLGFYTKGPVIFIEVLVFMGLYSYFFSFKRKGGFHFFTAFLLFLIAGFWWYGYLAYENSAFIDYFLGRQTLDRFSKNVFNRSEPWWYFLVLAPVTAAPWLFLIPFWAKEKLNYIKNDQRLKVLILSILIPVFFFSLSTSKRILYILPVYGFIAILSAALWDKVSFKTKKKSLYFISGFYSFFAFLILGLNITEKYEIPMELTLISIIYLLSIIWILFTNQLEISAKLNFLSLLFGVFILIASSIFMSKNPSEINSPRPLTDFILKNNLENKNIYIFNSRQPSIAFELNKSVISLYKNSRDLNREVQFENSEKWKEYLINLNKNNEIEALINQMKIHPSVLITYKEKKFKILDSLKSFYKNKKQFGKYIIYY